MPIFNPATSTGMKLITYTVLTGSAASIDFQSITSGYKGFLLVIQGCFGSSGGANVNAKLNNDSGANYNNYYSNSGAAYTSSAGAGSFPIMANLSSTVPTGGYLYLGNSSSVVKSYEWFSGKYNNTIIGVGYYNSATEISRITLTPDVGNFNAGTTVYLYGIL